MKGVTVVGQGTQSMQSDAIKSLQQRKAKRGLAKNLGRDIVGKTGVEQGCWASLFFQWMLFFL